MPTRRSVLTFLVAMVLSAPVFAQQPMPVLASFSILGDMARQIGGARVVVTDIVGPDQDSHGFQPLPAQVKLAATARVLLANGLGFDPYMDRLWRDSGRKGLLATVSRTLEPIRGAPRGHAHGHAQAHAGAGDPHGWQSVRAAMLYAREIAAAFKTADPAGAAQYDAGLAAYLARLEALDAEIRAAMATIPEERRVLTTTHDAFAYFARDYGLKVQALQGVSAESDPSAADMARIIRQLKALNAPAVFLENVTDPRKIEQIARETGARLGGTLYSDALSLANGPAATYIDMMRHNVRQIADALKPKT